jgi:hypothetical protein
MNRRRDNLGASPGAGRALRIVLYFALALSALVTMAGLPAIQQRVEAGQWHALWLIAPAVCFGLFLVIYIADRVWLLRHRNYPSGRALFQVVFGAVFLLLLLPSSIREYRTVLQRRPPRQSLHALMLHTDPRVRAVACELAAHRPEAEAYLGALAQHLEDRVPAVREAAQGSLEHVTGQLFSTDADGVAAFARYLESRGAVAAVTPEPLSQRDGSIAGDADGGPGMEDSGR